MNDDGIIPELMMKICQVVDENCGHQLKPKDTESTKLTKSTKSIYNCHNIAVIKLGCRKTNRMPSKTIDYQLMAIENAILQKHNKVIKFRGLRNQMTAVLLDIQYC